jgi:hypothetical protein
MIQKIIPIMKQLKDNLILYITNMPKKVIDYSNTIFYKFCCKDLDIKEIYVGHTTNFKQRKSMHKQACTNSNSKNYNLFVYQCIRDKGGWDNWQMIEIERKPCIDLQDALKTERYWFENLQATLNKQIPTRTQQEWCQENKEVIQEYYKEYYELHKDEIKQYRKEWYEENREKIVKQMAEKFNCICGSTLRKVDKLRHFKSQKHYLFIKQNKPLNQPTTETTETTVQFRFLYSFTMVLVLFAFVNESFEFNLTFNLLINFGFIPFVVLPTFCNSL